MNFFFVKVKFIKLFDLYDGNFWFIFKELFYIWFRWDDFCYLFICEVLLVFFVGGKIRIFLFLGIWILGVDCLCCLIVNDFKFKVLFFILCFLKFLLKVCFGILDICCSNIFFLFEDKFLFLIVVIWVVYECNCLGWNLLFGFFLYFLFFLVWICKILFLLFKWMMIVVFGLELIGIVFWFDFCMEVWYVGIILFLVFSFGDLLSLNWCLFFGILCFFFLLLFNRLLLVFCSFWFGFLFIFLLDIEFVMLFCFFVWNEGLCIWEFF